MTLLELLIVMVILMMITAAAIPLLAPAVQNRRMREASRMVSSYISGARSKAIESGQPVGVMIERSNGQPYAMTLSYVEQPPPYSGDTTGALCTVHPAGGNTFNVNFVSGINQSLVQVGDQIQFGFQGPLYQITASAAR